MRRTSGLVSAQLGLVLFASACGGSDAPTDAPSSDSSGPEATDPAAPDIPWLDDGVPPLEILPCPDGWREVADEGSVSTCDPFPEGGPLDCPDGEAHLPGAPDCSPVGAPCPSGEFSEVLPADRRVVYVQPGASGDGMAASTPYGSLRDFAIGGLPVGSVVALSRGTHIGSVRLARSVALWGACAAATFLTTAEPHAVDGVITIVRTQGEVHDLTVTDSPRPGILVLGTAAEAVVEGVVVSETSTIGVASLQGAHLTANGLVSRDTRGRPSDLIGGAGLSVELEGGADVSRASFERNRTISVMVRDESSWATLSDVTVRDTLGQASDAIFGRGLNVQQGARADVERVALEGNREFGLMVAEPGTVLNADFVVVRDTLEDWEGKFGRGINVQNGPTVTLSRVLAAGNRDVAFLHSGMSTGTAVDVVLRDTEPEVRNGWGGRGLGIEDGAILELTRAVVERNRELGVALSRSGSELRAVDLVVRGTDSDASTSTDGKAIGVQYGATLELQRALLDRNRQAGLVLNEADAARITDVVVRDTRSEEREGIYGRGISVQLTPMALLSRVRLERNRELGMFVGGDGTVMDATDLVIVDSRPRECAESTCPDFGSGSGLGVYVDGDASVTRFTIAGSDLCGVHLARGGQADLDDGEVSGSPIGACVQVADFAVERLTDGVRFVDNDINLEATMLPVPDTIAPSADGS